MTIQRGRLLAAASCPAAGLKQGHEAGAAGSVARRLWCAALVVVTATVASTPSAAWGQQGLRGVPGLPPPSLQPAPPFPVLPGVVGPPVDPAGSGLPEEDPPAGVPRQQGSGAASLERPVLPPPPLTWDRANEEFVAVTGYRHGAAAGYPTGRWWGIGVALVATLGLLLTAVLAAARRTRRIPTPQLPVSIISQHTAGIQRSGPMPVKHVGRRDQVGGSPLNASPRL